MALARFVDGCHARGREYQAAVWRGATGQRRLRTNGKHATALAQEQGDIAFSPGARYSVGMSAGGVCRVFDVGMHHVRLAFDQLAVGGSGVLAGRAGANAMGRHEYES